MERASYQGTVIYAGGGSAARHPGSGLRVSELYKEPVKVYGQKVSGAAIRCDLPGPGSPEEKPRVVRVPVYDPLVRCTRAGEGRAKDTGRVAARKGCAHVDACLDR